METQANIVLFLFIKTQPQNREDLFQFLRNAIPYYESLGGTKVKLLQGYDDPNSFVEIIEYDSVERYESDKRRLNTDSRMQTLITTWRGFLEGAPIVRAYYEVSDKLHGGKANESART